MKGRSVTFKKIVLEGFGPYCQRTEVRFSPGINNFTAENEQGKSSLVMGLMAVIFGLPAKNDPSEFGLARFKNWDSPSRCEGEVEFEAGSGTYRIKRNFDTNEVAVFRREGEEWVSVVAGVHNPLGRRGNESYERLLRELFSMTSREIFAATFCLTQPLPGNGRFDAEVQELLSGGGVDFNRVLSSLQEELKRKTKRTGDRGVTSQNMRNNRELENLEERIRELEQRIEEGRRIVDSLEKVQGELRALDKDLDAAGKELAGKEQILRAWSEWRRLRESYVNARDKQVKLAEAFEKAEQLEKSIAGSLADLKEQYPEFEGCSEGTQKALDKLISLRDKLKENEDDLQRIRQAIEEDQKEKKKLEEELKRYPGWDILGADPAGQVKTMKRTAGTLLREWEDFQKKMGEIGKLQELLEGKYSLFQQATSEELAAVKSYTRRVSELRAAREGAEKELEAARERVESHRRAVEAFKERYRDLEQLGPEAEEAARKKLDMLEKEKALAGKIEKLKQKLVPPPAARFAAAAILALVAGTVAGALAGMDNPVIPAVVALLGGFVGYAGAGFIHNLRNADVRKELEQAAKELASCQEEITAASSRLGEFARAQEAALGALLEKLRQRREERARLEEMERELPSAAEVERLQEDFLKASNEYSAFLELTGKFTQAFAEVEEAWAAWRDLVEKREKLAAEAQEYAQESFGCQPEQAASTDPLGAGTRESWRELTEFLQMTVGRSFESISCVVSFLRDCSSAWWEETEKKAATYAGVVEGLKKIEATISTKVGQEQEQRQRVEQLKEKEEQLVRSLAGILEKAGGDAQKARERWDQRCSSLEKIERERLTLRTILGQYKVGSIEEFKAKKTDAEIFTSTCMSNWQKHIDEHPGLPEIPEAGEMEKVTARINALKEEVERLEKRVNELREKREKLIEEQSRLQGQDLVNIAQAEIELGDLRERKEKLEILADALTEAFKELSGAIVDYQHSYRNHLQELATRYYRRITKMDSRRVIIDDDFNVRVEEEGKPCDINQLSKGARDQLYIALRFAIADLLAENVKLPFVFDDPFVSSDRGRLQNIRGILEEAQQERQFILLSHNDIFSDWGEKVRIQRCR